MMNHDKRDLIILGGGMVGMTLALTAAKAGFSCHVIDRAPIEALTTGSSDGRASAISTASWNLFGHIGLADSLKPLGCPIDAIAVSDGLKPGRIDFVPDEGEGALGRMFANLDLRLALFAAASAEPLIQWHAGGEVVARHRGPHGVSVRLEGGAELSASLMVGAEGRQSPSREEAGLTSAHWGYHHRAIVTALDHEKSHNNTAWEIFYPAGPFALLPLIDGAAGQHRSALVWTVAERHAGAMLALTDRAFLAEAEQRMGGVLGAIQLAAPKMSYPLGFHHAARIMAERFVLVGDAAHGIHPIAGQGLNLGLRDVAALIEVLRDGARLGLEPGDAQSLARYQRWRSLDSFMVASATDGLTRLFGIPGRLPSAVRRLGMGAVQRSGALKRWFIDEARGVSGQLPTLLQA